MSIALVAASVACQETGNINTEKPAPRLISIVPQKVWNGCTAIISGTGFSEVIEENTVMIDGVIVPITSTTKNRITLTMPEHEMGTIKVSVNVCGKDSDTELEAIYTELPDISPKVTGITPIKGFAGDLVTISGEYFSESVAETAVLFGGIEGKVQSASKNTIKVIAPEHAKGSVDVQVITGGKTLRAPSSFTYLHFAISSNYPVKGATGDKVTITGEGFSTVPAENTVMVGNEKATVESATETSLVVVMPDNAEGVYTFSVTVGERTVTGGQFTYGGSWRVESLITGYSKVQDIILGTDGKFWVTRREGAGFGVFKYDPAGNSMALLAESKSNTASDSDLLADSYPWGADLGPDGKLYFAAKKTRTVLTCDEQGNIAQYSIKDVDMVDPMKVLCAADGTLYVLVRASAGNGYILKVKDHEIIHKWELAKATYETMCFNPNKTIIFVFPCTSGDIQMIDLSDNSMIRIAGTQKQHTSASDYTDGTPGDPLTATLHQCDGAVCAADGTLYFTDSAKGKTIRTFKPGANGDYTKGTIETIAGIPYNTTVLPYPNGIALAADGKTLYYCDNGGKICKVYYK